MLDTLSRRRLLQAGAAGIITAPLLSRFAAANTQTPITAAAAAPFRGEFYRFKIGDLNAVVLSDGSWLFPDPKNFWTAAGSPDAFQKTLSEYRTPSDKLTLHVNILAIEHQPGKWVLVDAGARDFFGPTLGKLPVSLQAAGIAPDSVTDILLSHAHGDHFGGIFTSGNELFFPNAVIHAGEIEKGFWTTKPDISSTVWPDEYKKGFVMSAQTFFKNAAPRLRPFKNNEKLLGFITPVLTPGHTPGHMAFRVESAGESFLHLVDVPPHPVLSFSHPEWEVGWDTNRAVARATRIKEFAAADKAGTRLMGYHLPFPGIGRLRPYKTGHEWLPETPLFPV